MNPSDREEFQYEIVTLESEVVPESEAGPILSQITYASSKKPDIKKACGNCRSILKRELKCARCQKILYCNKCCQREHWKLHKFSCAPFGTESSPKPLPSQPVGKFGLDMNTKEGENICVRAILKARDISSTDADFFCSTCRYPAIWLASFEQESTNDEVLANATFICGEGHMSYVFDTRMSLEQECRCAVASNQGLLSSLLNHRDLEEIRSTVSRVLIVTAFDQVKAEKSCYCKKLKPSLRDHGIQFDVLRADDVQLLVNHLDSHNYSTVLFLHLAEIGIKEEGGQVFDTENLGCISRFIARGGKCIIHSDDGSVAPILQALSGKPWHFCGDFLRRCQHTCNITDFSHFPISSSRDSSAALAAPAVTPLDAATAAADFGDQDTNENSPSMQKADKYCESSETGNVEENDDAADGENGVKYAFPKKVNVKANLLSGVSREDQLYSPKEGARCVSAVPGFAGHIVPTFRTAVAATKVGRGIVCYIGDACAESKTIKTIIAIIEARQN